jgi:hypothetical protein
MLSPKSILATQSTASRISLLSALVDQDRIAIAVGSAERHRRLMLSRTSMTEPEPSDDEANVDIPPDTDPQAVPVEVTAELVASLPSFSINNSTCASPEGCARFWFQLIDARFPGNSRMINLYGLTSFTTYL